MNFKKCYTRIELEKKFLGTVFDKNRNYPLSYLQNTKSLLEAIENLKKEYKLSISQKKYLEEFSKNVNGLFQKLNEYSYHTDFYRLTTKEYLRLSTSEEIEDILKFTNKKFNKVSVMTGLIYAELESDTLGIPLEKRKKPKKEGIFKKVKKKMAIGAKKVKSFCQKNIKNSAKRLAPVALIIALTGSLGYGSNKLNNEENKSQTLKQEFSTPSNASKSNASKSNASKEKDFLGIVLSSNEKVGKSFYDSNKKIAYFEKGVSINNNIASASNPQKFEELAKKEKLIKMKQILKTIKCYGNIIIEQEEKTIKLENLQEESEVKETTEIENKIGASVNVLENASIYPDVESVVYEKNAKKSTYGNKEERIIESIIMAKDNDIRNVKNMEDYNILIKEGYAEKGYTLLNQYSVDNNGNLIIEGRFKTEDVALVRK